MRSTTAQIPDDLYQRLLEEKHKDKFTSLSEGIRYYLRIGMEKENSQKHELPPWMIRGTGKTKARDE